MGLPISGVSPELFSQRGLLNSVLLRREIDVLGWRWDGTDSKLRFRAPFEVTHVQVHVQNSSTGGIVAYVPGTSVSSTEVDCRASKVQDVTITAPSTTLRYVVFLIPVQYDAAGTKVLYDGQSGRPDNMSFVADPRQMALSTMSGTLSYSQLPTGGGTWANGGALSITGGVTTVAGLTSSALVNANLGLTVRGAPVIVRNAGDTASVVSLGGGQTANIGIDGDDGSIAAGAVGIFEAGGSLFYSSRNSHIFFLDNDANDTTGVFGIRANVATGGSNVFQVDQTGAISGDSTLQIDGNTLLGTTTAATGAPRLDVVAGSGINALVLADVITNATLKFGRVGTRHYTNTEEPQAVIGGQADSATGTVRIGGGFSEMNAATLIEFYTAANTTTTTGTLRAIINSSGNMTLGSVDGTGTGNLAMAALTATTGLYSGRVTLTSTNDVTLSGVSGALIIGGDGTGAHIAIDGNEIMAKASATTAASVLSIQGEGGEVQIGANVATGVNASASVGRNATTGNTATTLILNGGTNAGANNKDVAIRFERGTTPQWLAGVLGATIGANANWTLWDDVNNVAAISVVQGTTPDTTFGGDITAVAGTFTGLLQTTVTTQQLSLRYDASNHLAVTVASNGAVTYNATGAGANHLFSDNVELDGDLNHDGTNVGFYGTTPIAQQTGVAVTAAGIHAALVNLGLITA